MMLCHTDIEAALDGVRPSLQQEGWDVELIEVKTNHRLVLVRVIPTGRHPGLRRWQLQRLEEALKARVPEVNAVALA